MLASMSSVASGQSEEPLDLDGDAPLELSEGTSLEPWPEDRPIPIPPDPEGLFPSAEELEQALVDSTPWEYFDNRRADYELAPVQERTYETATQLQRTEGQTGIPLLADEAPTWEPWLEARNSLLDFNSEIALSPEFVTSTIDELNSTLTVWVQKSPDIVTLAESAPDGVFIVYTAWNHEELEQLRDKLDLESAARPLGLDVVAVREDGHGLSIDVSVDDARVGAVDLFADSLASLLSTAWESISSTPESPQVVVEVVDDPGPAVDLFCLNQEFRCPQMSGGRDINTGGNCTTGFALRQGTNSFERALSTAGHCLDLNDTATMATIGDDSPPFAGLTDDVGPYVQAQAPVDNHFHDVTALEPPASERGQIVPTYHMTNAHGNRPVEGTRASPPRNLRVCASARSNVNRTCGTITDEDYDNFVGGVAQYLNYLYIEIDGTGTLSEGDSGGPWTEASDPGIAVATIANGRDEITPGDFNEIISPRADLIAANYGNYNVIHVSEAAGYRDSFAAALYRLALQRGLTVGNLDYWSAVISPTSNTNPTTGCVADAKYLMRYFLQTAELETATPITTGSATQRLAQAERRVHRIYWTAFNRQPDAGGLTYWSELLRDDPDPEGVWDYMVTHFVNNISETTSRITGQVGSEYGPCV